MKKILIITTILLTTLSFTACNEWLDVSPRTEIKSADNYESEQGYKDALTGVYLLMTGNNIYGKELTFGMLDVLAQYYTGISSTSHSYYNESLYDYDETSCESRINSIWSSAYNVVANINELIAHIDEANTALFSGRNYHLIRGEAYGLRAMLHFDMLRLFGPSYKVGASTKAIPYVTVSGKDVTPLSSVEEVLTKALADLAIAEAELAVDPVIAEQSGLLPTDDETYQRDRTFKFNYYAVKMLQARIYLYMGNYTEAAKAVEPVLTQTAFTWVPEAEISTNDAFSKNYVFSEELIFSLYVGGLRDIYTGSFTSNSGLYMLEESYDAIYEMSTYGAYTDYRYVYQTEALTDIRVSTKLKQPENGNSQFHYRMPLMRLSEAFYIAAECALEADDLVTAAAHLNTVRQHRGLTVELQSTLTPEEMKEEIRKEYVKEFCCEGQLFYYYKRLNMPFIPVMTAVGETPVTTHVTPDYVLPLPDDEIEYGGRNDEKNN